jgi:hypothetical protein
MSKVSDLEQEVRRLINQPRKQSEVYENQEHWYKLCSSMDVIGDTELAFSNYLSDIDKPTQQGELYYLIYGIIQALYVQQDAVRHLSESLDLGYKNNHVLRKIRDLRNNSIGHPTERSHGAEDTSYNFITRGTMKRSGFMLMKSFVDGNTTFIDIDIPKLINDQRAVLENVLCDVVEKLKMEELNHRKEFRDKKLIDIFPQTLHYYYEKVTEGIYGNKGMYHEFGLGVLGLVEEVPKMLKEELISREIYDAYELEEDFKITEYALGKVREYFEQTEDGKFKNDDAWIYLSFVKKQMAHLQTIAKEIDEKYESDEV